MKQARGFGVGVVVATQNPMDLDYRALSQRRAVVPRPPPDRERQEPGARGPPLGRRRCRRRQARHGDRRAGTASVLAPERAPLRAGALLDSLGDVLPPRPLDQDQIETLTPDEAKTAPSAAAGDAAVPTQVAASNPGRGRERGRPDGGSGNRGPLARPGRAVVGASGSRSSAGNACGPTSQRGSASASTTRRRSSTRTRSLRRSTARSTRASTSTPRSPSTTTTETCEPSPFPTGSTSSLPSRSTTKPSFATLPGTPAPADRHAYARAPPEPRARPLLASRRDEEQFAERADEAAKTAADVQTAKIRDRLETKRDRLERALETARRRVEEAGTGAELAEKHGAPLRARERRRRPARRQGGHPEMRARSGARRSGDAAGDETRAAERKRSARRSRVAETTSGPWSRRSWTRWRSWTRPGRRRRRRSRPCRSGSSRATCACSRPRSSGCRRTDLSRATSS